MRFVQGKKVLESDDPLRLLREARRVVVDVGAGDGRWVYESARSDPSSLFVALDPDVDALAEYSFRASRKPARGGVPNALFVAGSVEAPPEELVARADEVTVLFPWAALLRGLLLPEGAVLRGLAAIAAPGAAFRLVLTYDASHDHGAGVELPSLDDAGVARLAVAYAAAGLHVEDTRKLTLEEALAIPSSWGRRLLHGRERDVFLVEGRFR